MKSVAVIDYGASNLRSVVRALEHVAERRHQIDICDTPEAVLKADKIVFPGQGAIRHCMDSLREKNLDMALLETLKTRPFLGLCLGLQSLFDSSEEDGGTPGFGIIPGKVMKFPEHKKDDKGNLFKIPHMGWNNVEQGQAHPLWKGINTGERFYFVHSYYVCPEQEADISGTTNYIKNFTSAIARDNLFAVQFHPEKSQKAGLKLLSNFLDW
ncbi:MAG: imidazole glycerol phosphate synthase subunit HisH [Gammaproteobacteria bacterium]